MSRSGADRVALFIDGAYLDFVQRELGLRSDFKKLIESMKGDIDLLRCYYYHCPPYQSSPPTEPERERFSAKEKFFYSISSLPRVEVRRGKLEFRGKDANGNPIFEQKRIDILLGVDLVLLAAKGAITHACIIAGDSDFLPAIQAAKNEGVLVHLFHGNSYHRELWNTADERTLIDKAFINKIKIKAS